MEIFKDTHIEGYKVSNYGRVISKSREIKANANGGIRFTKEVEKKPSDNGKGYMFLWLYQKSDRVRVYLHRLVAEAFIPNPENKPTVNHINGDKTDNRVENLEWATYKENNVHAVAIGLNRNLGGGKPIIQKTLDGMFVAEFKSASEASRLTKISRSAIQECCKPFRDGQGHTAGGYKWEFKNQNKNEKENI